MRVQLIAKREREVTGISRHTEDLSHALAAAGLETRIAFPMQPPIPWPIGRTLRQAGLDVQAFFDNYPLRAPIARAEIYHLVGQMLATLLLFQRFPAPVAVTVHDIIPYLVRDDPDLNTFRHPIDRLFYRLALAGLSRADRLIASSQYTRQTLIRTLRIPPERIAVVHPAVNHQVFRPQPVPDDVRARYGLSLEHAYILFVGSEDPRKNVQTLVKAMALLKGQVPSARLLKIGSPKFPRQRQNLLRLLSDLEMEGDALLLDYVPERDLPYLYNAASVLVLPSLYEGFGLPPLEAMACGTPVVCAATASLPEVVGDAGVRVDPDDVCGLADALGDLLTNADERRRLGEAARQRAAGFSWDRLAAETRGVYLEMHRSRRHAARA